MEVTGLTQRRKQCEVRVRKSESNVTHKKIKPIWNSTNLIATNVLLNMFSIRNREKQTPQIGATVNKRIVIGIRIDVNLRAHLIVSGGRHKEERVLPPTIGEFQPVRTRKRKTSAAAWRRAEHHNFCSLKWPRRVAPRPSRVRHSQDSGVLFLRTRADARRNTSIHDPFHSRVPAFVHGVDLPPCTVSDIIFPSSSVLICMSHTVLKSNISNFSSQSFIRAMT